MCLALKDNEYLFIYNSQNILDREAAGYIRTLNSLDINEQDINNDMLTETQIVAAAKKLGVDIHQMVQSDTGTDVNFTEEEILKLLKKQPMLLKTPFVISENRSFFIKSPLNLIKEQF